MACHNSLSETLYMEVVYQAWHRSVQPLLRERTYMLFVALAIVDEISL